MIPSYEITSIVYIYIYILDSKDRIQSDDIHYESVSVRSKPWLSKFYKVPNDWPHEDNPTGR